MNGAKINSLDRQYYLQRAALACWIALTVAVALLFARAVEQGLHFETDLRALLPDTEQSRLAQAAGQQLFDYGGDRIALVVVAPDRHTAVAAATLLEQRLQAIPQLALEQMDALGDVAVDQLTLYRRHRFHLLSAAQREALQNGAAEDLAQAALRQLYDPRGWARIATPAEDPLNLLQGFYSAIQATAPPFEFDGEQLLLTNTAHPERGYALLSARSESSVLKLETQAAIVADIDRVAQELSSTWPGTELLRSGIVFHAAAAAGEARREISIIGAGSALGIVLLFMLTFASLRPLFLSLGSVLYGALCALTLCHYLFGTIHLLTLVFGASLLGVGIDYALHYFTRLHGDADDNSGSATLRSIFPAIALGLITTLIGYGNLAQAPLPGLQQIAAFSVAGLASAWLCVVALFPFATRPSPRPYPAYLQAIAAAPWRVWQRISPRYGVVSLLLIAALCLLVCWQGLRASSDIRALYAPSPALLHQEQRIQSLLGSLSPNQFFLLHAEDPDSLLQREEALHNTLDQLVAVGAIDQWQGISRYLPSLQQQRGDYQLLADTVYGDNGAAWPLMAQLGFSNAEQSSLRQRFDAQREDMLLPDAWLQVASAEQALPWLGPLGGGFASMVTLRGVNDLEALTATAANTEGLQFVDRVAQMAAALEQQRHRASILLAAAYGLVMVILLLRYRSLAALLLLLVPALSTLLTLTLFALAAVPITLFHTFALFLVLGLGMDYSIFSREAARGDNDCRLAILLSATTSCLSFGLLALSTTPMVQAFGVTVLLGSLLNVTLVPLVDRFSGEARA